MPKDSDNDILWKMLSSELSFADIREIEAWLDGQTDYTEMGYGRLTIDAYDGVSGGKSTSFRLRHDEHGALTISRAALATVLNDLLHDIRRGRSSGEIGLN